jgi:hypothetical protein
MIFRIVLVTFLFSNACVPRTFGSSNYMSDSFVKAPSLKNQSVHAQKLALAFPKFVTFKTYGKIEGVEEELFFLRFGLSPKHSAQLKENSSRLGQAPAILITDTTHGDEYTGIVDRMTGRIAVETNKSNSVFQKFFNAGGVIYFFPVVNPSGYKEISRNTSLGVDLNRKYLNDELKNYPELRFLIESLDTNLLLDNAELRFTADYHCCTRTEGSELFLMPAHKDDPKRVPDELIFSMSFLKSSAAKFFPNLLVGTSAALLPPKNAKSLEKKNAVSGTSKDYFYNHYTGKFKPDQLAASITIEGIKKVSGERNPNEFLAHFEFWQEIAEQLSL